MAFTCEELDRLVDDTRHRGVITGDVYCGNCGYNLKTLPYVYQCPECGHEYNARPLSGRGIFFPSQCFFPWRELTAAVIVAVMAVSLGCLAFLDWNRVYIVNPFLLGMAILLGWTAVRVGRDSIRALGLYGKRNQICRRIADQEESATKRTPEP